MTESQANIHHYVPQWYQRQFLLPGQEKLFVLDLTPPPILRPDGSFVKNPDGKVKHYPPVRPLATSEAFQQEHLYTTKLFGKPSDIIEKRLFGKIDTAAARLIPTFVMQGWEELPKHGYDKMMAYIDIQRLRTPAGLDFIRKLGQRIYGYLFSQNTLMMLMQQIRNMHITMWAEGFHEIVSAEDSDIKFIVSDQPVTFYNCAAFPGSKWCAYPNDPDFRWEGTQTIFATDPNHCMIFTHHDFAHGHKTLNPLKNRINARSFQPTIHRLHDWIRKRKLDRREVAAINFLLKSRAKKFIAAGNKDWLYPEKDAFTTHWSKLKRLTIPKEPLGRMGDTFLGYEDGSVYHQDVYGRQTLTPEQAKEEAARMKRQLDQILKKDRAKKLAAEQETASAESID